MKWQNLQLRSFTQQKFTNLRLHGDCHASNILMLDDTPYFVDFDDCKMGPAIQDIWMLLSGSQQEQQLQLVTLLEGYEEHFVRLIMQTIRYLLNHYVACVSFIT